uniref:Antistasin-like domain-containing protein n=2 Tax=Magallana gigas TaxID=29159 RepID=A0A8W8P185_MAGGI
MALKFQFFEGLTGSTVKISTCTWNKNEIYTNMYRIFHFRFHKSSSFTDVFPKIDTSVRWKSMDRKKRKWIKSFPYLILGSFRSSRATASAGALSPFDTSMYGNNGGFGFPGFPSYSGQMGPVNPMASMFGSGNPMSGSGNSPMSRPMGFSGGMSPMGGFMGQMNPMMGASAGLTNQKTPNVNQTDCDPAPYTCPAPPPWCQRIVDEKGCTKCACGNDLKAYYDKLKGVTENITSTTTAAPVNQTVTVTSQTTPSTTAVNGVSTTTDAPPLGKACLANFFCTLDCRTGYQTDATGCPLCVCNADIDIFTQAPPPDSSTSLVPLTTVPIASSSSPGGVASFVCPGIFDCMKQCMNGYRVDSRGCPRCECIQ